MYLINRLQFSILITLPLLICGILSAEIREIDLPKLNLNDCLLPKDHPLQEKLHNLFADSDMFKSPQHLQNVGFNVLDRVHRGLMVASHPAIENYLIKKFQDSVSQKSQLANYIRRINGARNLSEFIKLNNLQHIIVPQKWLYQLPKHFSDAKTGKRTYVLIVEEIDLCDGGKDPQGEVAKRYYNIDLEILRELCTVVYFFRGLDSMLHNMPFTYQNKIAFIDTERWNWKRKGYLKQAMPFMSHDRQKYALNVFKELQKQNHR